MAFQQPIFLYGLFLLAIPILIHFLNFRRSKTLYFSSLRFIEEIKSTYRKRNRLTDLLLLLLRLLAMAGLIIAFAQPVIKSGDKPAKGTSSVTGLYIDNSLSMEVAEKGESLLARAKAEAKKLVGEFPPDTRFRLLFSSPDQIPGITDRELTSNLIDGIGISEKPLSMDDILRYFSQVSESGQDKISSVILISDFQESLFSKALPAAAGGLTLYPVALWPSQSANISIDTCWLENPISLLGQNNSVIARINNRSSQDYEEFPVRLMINDTLRNETSVRLPASAVTEVMLGFHPTKRGWQTGSVQISDFPVTFDNELLFSFNIESDIRVLHLHGSSDNLYLASVFGNDPFFRWESYTVKGFPRSDFADYNLVILSGTGDIDPGTASKTRDYLANGGTVWFLPEMDGQIGSYNDLLKSLNIPQLNGIARYRVESRIGQGQETWLQSVVVNVDKRLRLPYFNQSYRILPAMPDRTDLLNSVTGDLLLSRFTVGKGSFVLSGFPLDPNLTDFMFHPLFIPICYRIATLNKHSSDLYQIVGNKQPVRVINGNNGEPVRLRNKTTGFETIPPQHQGTVNETVLFPADLQGSGLYSAISGTDTIARIAFNASRTESALQYLPDSVMQKRYKASGWNISMNNNSFRSADSKNIVTDITVKKIWYYFLIMALLALIAESLVMNAKK